MQGRLERNGRLFFGTKIGTERAGTRSDALVRSGRPRSHKANESLDGTGQQTTAVDDGLRFAKPL
jgi:hypothetical protein